MTKWTQADKDRLAELLPIPGMSAAKIAQVIGGDMSKNAILGLVRRNPELKAIGLHGVPNGGTRGGRPKKTNVVQFPSDRRTPANRNVPSEQPKLQVITNTKLLIADYIAKHGVRRFKERDTVDYYSLQSWLSERGYTLSMKSSLYTLSNGRGRPKVMPWRNVVQFVDKMRKAEGLLPILRSA